MADPTVEELNELLTYLDRAATILQNMARPQIEPPKIQSVEMQILFRNKLYHLCDRLISFLSVGEDLEEQLLLRWLDTILDIRKQMWDAPKAYAAVNWGQVDIATGAIIETLQAYLVSD